MPLFISASLLQVPQVDWNFRSLLRYFNDKQRISSIYSRFEEAASRYEKNLAVEYAGQALTYGELRQEAERIAALLSRIPTRKPARVALFFENRLHAISAIFGILKSGHAFIPLDPADPKIRIQTILADSDPIAMLTDTANLHRSTRLAAKKCLVIDIEAPQSTTSLKRRPFGANNLAYLFYTSGSTGTPKGVCQTQDSHLYFIDTYAQNLKITSDDRLSLLYTLSFSAANMDIFGALLNGATVCAYDMRQQGIPGLCQWIEKERITVLHAVPTVFRKLAQSLPAGKVLEKIRAIDLGGEALGGRDVELFSEHFSSSCLFFNRLAATEISVIAQYPIAPADAQRDVLPVGYAPEQVAIRIERSDGSLASTNECGRMVISSPHVSPGYWQRPSLNATYFRDDPSRPGWREFRTEDMGYIDAEGLLHFQGRDGTRVKIRGHSVDITEVEVALRQCDGISDVAIVAVKREPNPEADILVAYLVTGKTGRDDPVILRRELASRLPHYMLPTVFIFTEALPLTATGKIDRRALQTQPLPNAVKTPDPALMPSDETERQVAQLFEELLASEAIMRTDDFFLSGGDSLSAVELQVRLSGLLGKNFPLHTLLADSTVAGIAHQLCTLKKSTATKSLSPVLVPLRETGEGPALFLVHGRLGQAPVSPKFLSLFSHNQAIYTLQARGLENGDAPNETVDAMARDYVTAMRLVQPEGPYLLGGLCAGGHVAMFMASLLRAAGEKVLPLLLIDPPPPPFSKHARLHMAEDSQGHEEYLYRLKNSLHRRSFLGRGISELDSPSGEQIALRIALTFQKAMMLYQPLPYEHPVYLLASTNRCGSKGWGDPTKRQAIFAGPLKIFEVGQSHGDVINVNNALFRQAVSDYLQEMIALK